MLNVEQSIKVRVTDIFEATFSCDVTKMTY